MHRLSIVLLLSLLACAATAQNTSTAPWVPSPSGPQYFAVGVEDIDRSLAWYKTAFGLKQLDDMKDAAGAWRIVNLSSDSLFVELIWDSRTGKEKNGRGFFKVGFSVADVRPIAERVGTATGEKPRIIDDEKHKIRIVQLRDPDGNILQFASPLKALKGKN